MKKVQVVFIGGVKMTFEVDNRQQALELLVKLQGEPFVGWPDSPTPVFFNTANILYAVVIE